MFKMDFKRILAYMLLGLGFATVMGFVYMQYVYYDAMLNTMQVTNAQLGFLITISAIVAVITCIPGGIIADKYDCRKVLTLSLGGIMLSCAVFALFPKYFVAMFVWGAASFFMSAWYCAIYKTVRVIAPEEAIGKSFGLFGVGVAIGSLLVNIPGLKLYEHFAEASLQTGLSAILWAFFICGMISCLGAYVLIKDIDIAEEEKENVKYSVKDFFQVIKNPGVWLFVLTCFCIYSFQISISYFTPYFTAVLGTTVTFSGIIAVFRQYGLRIISSPLGGWYGDKIGSTAKVVRGSMCILAALVLIVLFLPQNTSISILVAIVFILGLLGTMNISLQSSITADALIPPAQMGVAVGLTSLFTADLFQATLFGHWLDVHGNGGYNYIWIYTLCVLIACIILITIMLKRKQHMQGLMENKDQQPV